jgi:hypothetical protein
MNQSTPVVGSDDEAENGKDHSFTENAKRTVSDVMVWYLVQY